MEKLEKTLEVQEKATDKSKNLVVESPIYEGLVKVEEINYRGPTSIKYWM